ncbi:hypothetical protein JRQ81_019587, partial [Phrynocephalus forsythii]
YTFDINLFKFDSMKALDPLASMYDAPLWAPCCSNMLNSPSNTSSMWALKHEQSTKTVFPIKLCTANVLLSDHTLSFGAQNIFPSKSSAKMVDEAPLCKDLELDDKTPSPPNVPKQSLRSNSLQHQPPVPSSKKHFLKVVSWNVAGWSSKLADKSFKSFCFQFGIIFIQETWATATPFPTLPGYVAHSWPASKCSTRGRARGGLATLISVDDNPDILVLDMGLSHNIQIIQVTWLTRLKFFLINVYVPPHNSRLQSNTTMTELDLVFSKLFEQQMNPLILLAGDLNARMGENNFIVGDKLGDTGADAGRHLHEIMMDMFMVSDILPASLQRLQATHLHIAVAS